MIWTWRDSRAGSKALGGAAESGAAAKAIAVAANQLDLRNGFSLCRRWVARIAD